MKSKARRGISAYLAVCLKSGNICTVGGCEGPPRAYQNPRKPRYDARLHQVMYNGLYRPFHEVAGQLFYPNHFADDRIRNANQFSCPADLLADLYRSPSGTNAGRKN